LRQTFDFTASASDHLREAGVIEDSAYRSLAAVELVTQRLLLALGAVGLSAWAWSGSRNRYWVLGLLVSCFFGFAGVSAVLGWAGLLGLAFLSGAVRESASVALLGAAVLLTAAVHGVFFGAGRYALPLWLLSAPLTAVGVGALNLLTVRGQEGDNSFHGPH
jgi:fucose 4-O-acetylase-like acetyltransferase